ILARDFIGSYRQCMFIWDFFKERINLFFRRRARRFMVSVLLVLALCKPITMHGQDFNVNSAVYNTLLGGLSAGVGAMITKPKEVKFYKAFARGFVAGMGGGAVMYCGKKLNF